MKISHLLSRRWDLKPKKANKKGLKYCIKPSLLKWQGWQESNPRQRFWRPLYYHCTTPLTCLSMITQYTYLIQEKCYN